MKRLLTFLLLLTGFVLPSAKTMAQRAFINAPDSICAGSFATLNGLLWNSDFTVDHMDWSVSPALAADEYEFLFTENGLPSAADKWVGRTPGSYAGVTAMTIRLNKVGEYTFTVKIYEKNGSRTATISRKIKVKDCTITQCAGTISTMAGFKEDFGIFNAGDRPRKNRVIDSLYTNLGAASTYRFPTNITSLNIADNEYVEYYHTQAKPEWVKAYDRTGNGDNVNTFGGMLVINSAIEKKSFYQRTIKNLCPGSIYNFSAWFMNVNGMEVFDQTCARASDTKPDGYHYAGVTFILTDPTTGAVLQRFNTNDVSMNLRKPEWQQYGGSFKIPPNLTSVKLTILNNNFGGCGNDIAIDDIQFTYCSPDLFAYVDGLKDEKRIKDQICGGAPLSLTAYLEPITYFQDPVYQWQISTDGVTYTDMVDGPMNAGTVTGSKTPILNFTAGALKGDPSVAKLYYFRVGITEKDNVKLGNCAAPSRPVEITILPQPQISVTGNEICNGQNAHLEVTGGYTSYTWKVNPLVTGTTLDVSPNVTTTYEVVGEKSYGDNKVCRDSNRAEILVYQKPIVNVKLLTPPSICEGEIAKLEIQPENSVYDITWDYNGTVIAGAKGTSITHTPTKVTNPAAVPPAKNIYTVTVTNGKCIISDQAEVIVNSMPKPNAGTDIKLCNTTSFTLAGSQPLADQTGMWSFKGGINEGATLNNPTSYNATVTNLAAGKSVTLVWTITNKNLSKCAASDEVVLINMPLPVSAATIDITQCANKVFNISGTAPAAWETGQWSGTGVTFGDPNSPLTTATLTGTATTQDITVTWTLRNGKCADGLSKVNLHLRPAPAVTVTVPAVCQTAKQFTINFSALSGTVTKYTVKQGIGTPLAAFTNVTGTWPATGSAISVNLPANTPAGTYDFILTIQDGNNQGCTYDAPFKLRVDAQPDATISGPTDICLGTSVTLSVAASNSGYTKLWTIDGVTQTGSTQSITHTPTSAGTHNYSVKVTNLTCSDTKTLAVEVRAVPVADPGTASPQCNVGNFTMNAPALPVDQEGVWTISGSANGAVITDPTNPKTTVTGLQAGKSVVLTWTVNNKYNKTCKASSNITLTNTEPLTVSKAGVDITQCGNNQFKLSANAPKPTETGTWSGTGVTFSNPNDPAAVATLTSTSTPQTVTVTWTISNGVCTNSTSSVKLTLNAAPTVTVATVPAVCNADAFFNLVLSNPTGIITKYSIKPAATNALPSFTPIVDAAWTGAGTIKVNYPAATPAGTYNFVLTIQDGTNAGCAANYPFSVTIDAKPTVNVVASPTEICEGETTTLSIAAGNAGYTIRWTLNGTAIAGTDNKTTFTHTPTGTGNKVYAVSVKNGACTVTDDATVIVRSMPTADAGKPEIKQCDTKDFTVTGNQPAADQKGVWSFVGANLGAQITNPNNYTTTVTGVPAGSSVTLQWTVTNNFKASCVASDQITLTNTLALTVSKAGIDITQCGNNQFKLSANAPKPTETGTWSGTGVTFSNPNDPAAVATLTSTSTPQTVTVTWTISNGVCTNSTSSVKLTLNAAPTVTVATVPAVCNADAFFNLVLSNPTGIITKYSIKPAATNALPSFTPIVDAAWTGAGTIKVNYPAATPAGTYNFVLTIQDGTNAGCVANYPFSVTIDAKPTVNVVASPTEICEGETTTLSIAAGNAGYTIRWTLNNAPIAGTDNKTTFTHTPTGTGNKVYAVSVKNGACTVTDDATVIVRSMPTADAGNPEIKQCDTKDFTVTGNKPAADQKGVWSFVGANLGAQITNPNNYTTTVTGVPAGSSVTLQWTVTNTFKASCVASDQITLTNTLALTVSKAGIDITQCGNNQFKLSANAPKPTETGTWSGTGVTFSNPNDPAAVATLTSASAPQTVTVTWTISNGGVCTNSSSSIKLTLNAAPTVAVATVPTVCSADAFFNLVLSNPTGNITKYSIKPAATNALPSFTPIVDAPWTGAGTIKVNYPATTPGGTYDFVLTVQDDNNAGCVFTRTFSVKIDQNPAVKITALPYVVCEGTAATLSIDNSNAGYTIRWTLNGTPIPEGDNKVSIVHTPTKIGDNVYAVTVTNGVCTATDNVTIKVRSMPNANIDRHEIKQCNNPDFSVEGREPLGDQKGMWSFASADLGAKITDPTNYKTTVTGVPVGQSVTLRWTVSNIYHAACVASAYVVLTNVEALTESNAGTDITQCGDNKFQLNANAPKPTETGTWSGTGVTFSNPNDPKAIATLNTSTPQTVTVTWTISNGVCTNSTSSIKLILNAAPTVAVAAIPAVCNADGAFNLVLSNPTGAITLYSVKAVTPNKMAGFTDIINQKWNGAGTYKVTYPAATPAGTYNFVLTIQDGANAGCVTNYPFTVTVDAKPTVDVVATPAEICKGETTTLSIGSSNAGNTIRWTLDGVAIPAANDKVSFTQTPGKIGNNVYAVTVTNGACTVTDNVTVVVRSMPTADAGVPEIKQCDTKDFTVTGNQPLADQKGVWSFVGNSLGAQITNPNNYTTTVTGVPAGSSVTLLWTVTNNFKASCTASDQIILTNTLALTVSKAGTDITQCGDNKFQLNANTPKPTEKGTWSGTGVTFSNPNDPKAIATLNTSTPQTVTVTWTISNGVCTNSTSSIKLILNAAPTVAVAAIPAVCNADGAFNLVLSNPTGAITLYSVKAVTPNKMAGFTDIINQKWNGAGTYKVTYPAATPAGTYNFVLTIQDGANAGCVTNYPFTVTVDAKPTVDVVATPAEICKGETTTLSIGSSNAGYTIRWTLDGVAIPAANDKVSFTQTPGKIGNNVYAVTVTNGACTVTDNVTVVVRSMPAADAGVPEIKQCDTKDFTVTGNQPLADQKGVWSFVGNSLGAQITNPNNYTTTVTGVPAGSSVTLLWTVTNNFKASCTASDQIILTNTLALTVSKAGTDITQCGDNKFQLNANTPKPTEKGTWSGTGVTFSNPNDPKAIATLNTSTPQTVTVTWTISNGVCTNSTSSIKLILNAAPTVAVAAIPAVCNADGAFNLVLSNPTGAITLYSVKAVTPNKMAGFTDIINQKWNGAGTYKVTYPAATPAGTYNFVLTIQDGANAGCVTNYPFTVTVDAKPTVDVVATPAEICKGETTTLSIGSSNAGYTIRWTLDGIAIPGTDNKVSFSHTPIKIGDNVYAVSVKNGACTVTDNVIVQVRSMPTADAGVAEIKQCNNSSFTVTGNQPLADQKGVWSFVGNSLGAKITTPNNYTTTITGVPAGSSVTLLWTVTNNFKASCTASDQIILTNTEALTESKAGFDITQCGDNKFQLNANTPKPTETGTWSGTGVTFSNPNDPKAIATLNTSTPQTVTVTWTISNGVCTNSTSSIKLILNAAPTVGVAAVTPVCNTDGSFNMVVSNPTGIITLYSVKATTPNKMAGFTDIINQKWNGAGTYKVTFPTSAPAGTYDFVLTVQDGTNAGCTRDVHFTVKIMKPSTPATGLTVNAAEICDKGDVVLTIQGGSLGTDENGATNATWKWYINGCPGTTGSTAVTPDVISADGRTATFKNVSKTTTWFVRAESTGPCGNAATCASAKVTVYELPAKADAGQNKSFCNVKTDLKLEGNDPKAAGATGKWTTNNPKAIIRNPDQPVTGVYLPVGETATFTWTITNGVCAVTSDDVVLTNYETPVVANAGEDQEQCDNENFTLNGNAPTQFGAAGKWTASTMTGVTIADPANAKTRVTVKAGTTVTFTWTITNGTCAATSDNVVITNYAVAAAANAGPDQEACNQASDFMMKANVPSVPTATGKWKDVSRIPGRAVIKQPTNPLTAVTVPVGDTVVLEWTITNGACKATSSRVTIINYKAAAVANAGPDQEKCNTTGDFVMDANQPGASSATGTWTDISRVPGRATIYEPNNPATKVKVPVGDTVVLKWTITNGKCASTSSQVTLINYAKALDANAGPDQEACNQLTDFTLAADKPSVSSATGFWSIIKGTAVIRSINSPVSKVKVNPGDTVTLRWTITNGVCSSTWDDVTLINYLTPVAANAGPNQEHCDNATFNMNASDPGVPGAKGVWVVTSNNAALITISNATDRKATITVPAGETAQLTWVVSNGKCAATSSSVTLINRKPILGNSIQADQTVCTTETPTAIRGNVLSGGNGTYTYVWQQSTAGAAGPFTNIPGATTDTYQPGLLTADIWYRRIVASGACINNISNVVKITVVNKAPIVVSQPAAITTECVQGKDYTTLFGKPVFSHAPYDDVSLNVTYNDVTTVTSPCLTTITRTWTATDRCGLFVTASQTITVVDTKAPVFTTPAPANITVDCDKVPARVDLIAKDDCAGDITIPVVEVRKDIPGACGNNYQLIRTWTAKDACNTGVTLTQIITVKDMTAPVFTLQPPADTTVNCDKVPAGINLTATDNCTPGIITVTSRDSIVRKSGICASNYTIYRKWTALDECGNGKTVQQILRVQDTTRPVFSLPTPKDTLVDCDKVPAWPVITATDNCSGNIQVFTSSKTQKIPGACAGNYLEIRTWTATDDCGNKATMQQTIRVQDTTKPVFTVVPPGDTTVNCDAIPAPATNVTATDNCSTTGNGLTVTRQTITETIPGACGNNYRIIRTWTAKDACGNIATMKQIVTVQDTTRPVIMPAPADVTVYCQDPIPAPVTLTATDNCDPSFPKKAVYSEDPFVKDICKGYTIVRRWSITDACGNKANDVIQRIIIQPCPKPQLSATLPANCSDNPRVALQPVGDVNLPTFTLVAVTPANAVTGLPLTQRSNQFNLNGATSASFIMTDGKTGCSSDTMTYQLNYIQKPVVNLGQDTTICGGNSLVLDAGASNFAYTIKWSTGETTQRIKITQAGIYWVNISNGQCETSDTIKVGLIPTPLVSIPDTTICRGQSVKLDAYVDGATYLWSTGATTASILVSTQEQFWVKVMKSACITIDTVKVSVNPPPDITLSRDTAICPDQSIMLTVNSNGGRIRWQTGETSNSIIVNKPGGYWVAVSRDNCVVRDTVNVRMKPGIQVDLGPDRNICPDGTVTFNGTNTDAISYLWNDGDTNPIKQVSQAGKYKLAVMDRFCQRVYLDSVNVNITGVPKINLGNDTVMCIGETLTLRAEGNGITSVRWDNGSTSPTLQVTNGGTYTVTVFNDCGSATDDIRVNFTQCEPKPQFPNAFSPNGDGRNDVFRPIVRGPMFDYELRIFNRWGELIFISSDSHKGWDGKFKGSPVDIGTYVWWLTYKKVAGGASNVIKGEVTVVR
ncbi:gliding motility-associated C-terminal domain-containing protein [Chitinophaga oryzae]|uniref:Gliding motility-associated C-terminal domain-containing protein n=1 Tax=Chitinophaga oryzae TaxID=2725414 RepID=A0ABX6LC32_9BACT|nr:gliding motility-associated C-terminal domain-containing protein [Chitinophaga oryzae]QJB37585.1 gliding motility-associated C-terminal domain-containing protein [Chitinophaga oryzae]